MSFPPRLAGARARASRFLTDTCQIQRAPPDQVSVGSAGPERVIADRLASVTTWAVNPPIGTDGRSTLELI